MQKCKSQNRYFKETKHVKFSEKCMCAYQEVRNVHFSENSVCCVFLKHPFSDQSFCLIPTSSGIFKTSKNKFENFEKMKGTSSSGKFKTIHNAGSYLLLHEKRKLQGLEI